ncbi:radical SAM domain protein [Pelomyxa schiedti]|nr:radical SAM domain protein [Pelomyxa schiedti]
MQPRATQTVTGQSGKVTYTITKTTTNVPGSPSSSATAVTTTTSSSNKNGSGTLTTNQPQPTVPAKSPPTTPTPAAVPSSPSSSSSSSSPPPQQQGVVGGDGVAKAKKRKNKGKGKGKANTAQQNNNPNASTTPGGAATTTTTNINISSSTSASSSTSVTHPTGINAVTATGGGSSCAVNPPVSAAAQPTTGGGGGAWGRGRPNLMGVTYQTQPQARTSPVSAAVLTPVQAPPQSTAKFSSGASCTPATGGATAVPRSMRPSGTREWASQTLNCVLGCEHDCKYCYAKYDACERFGRIPPDQWTKPVIRWKEVNKPRPFVEGTTMFPSTHDITPSVEGPCITMLTNILRSGNQVLIVSKPHLSVIQHMCEAFTPFKNQILFRFTIGAMDDTILQFWEPGAPPFAERLASLKHAFSQGYGTSVSAEPMLDSDHVIDLYSTLEPFVTDSIWIGKMNKLDTRCTALLSTPEGRHHIKAIERGQTDQRIREIYNALHLAEKVKWKESIKQVMGLPSGGVGDDM